jgi:hypothetical protein
MQDVSEIFRNIYYLRKNISITFNVWVKQFVQHIQAIVNTGHYK